MCEFTEFEDGAPWRSPGHHRTITGICHWPPSYKAIPQSGMSFENLGEAALGQGVPSLGSEIEKEEQSGCSELLIPTPPFIPHPPPQGFGAHVPITRQRRGERSVSVFSKNLEERRVQRLTSTLSPSFWLQYPLVLF